MNDAKWFAANPTRQARIRPPERTPQKDKQRAVRYLHEAELQFRSLGPHTLEQRRLLIYRVPADNPMAKPGEVKLLTIPLLAFPGEVILDIDECLLPLLEGLMEGQL
jgi:hypothetical protein